MPMRRRPHAGTTLALVATPLLMGGCVDRAEERPEETTVQVTEALRPIGSSMLGQEAPPAVGRPSGGGARTPRMAEGELPGRYPFYWTRAAYTSGGRGWYGRGRPAWATDFPKGDQQFLVVLKRLMGLNAYDWENPVHLADPKLRRHPLIYMVEVGQMDLTDAEVEGLRSYLLAGGFMIADDFWGSREWAVFEWNMARVFPEFSIVDLPMDHEIFSVFYDIDEIVQVPSINGAIRGRTYERDGVVPHVRGIFDGDGRLMVVINWNTDLGDAWEWAESPRYPLEYSTFAYEMGANMIVYGMTH